MFSLTRHVPPASIAVALVAGSAPILASAQQAADAATPWGVGLAAASFQRPYAGAANKTIAFPALSFENDYIKLAGAGIDLKLFSAGPVNFALRTKYALGDGYKSGNAPILEGMADRKGSLWTGPAASWNNDVANVSVEVLADVLRKSKGVQGRLNLDHNLRAGSFVFTPHAAAVFLDKKYVDYYYGVAPSEARPNRPAYEGKSTVNLEGGFRTAYLFDAADSVFLDLSATALGKAITDSPLVDRKFTAGVVLGYLYRF